ncbi:hypothetical protein CERSUDRAFT_48557, partial [Gelatoporia subvermispora B]
MSPFQTRSRCPTVVADGLSRSREGLPRTNADGSAWSVCEDWESEAGLVNDLFLLEEVSALPTHPLIARFQEEPLFREVVEAILDLDSGDTDPAARRRAAHRASQYVIDQGKLWKLFGGPRNRARSRVECVTRTEAIDLAREQHASGGHWGRDAVKIALMDRIWSPHLDRSILTAI